MCHNQIDRMQHECKVITHLKRQINTYPISKHDFVFFVSIEGFLNFVTHPVYTHNTK